MTILNINSTTLDTDALSGETVMINGNEYLDIDNGRPVSKAIFLEVEQILDTFVETMISCGLHIGRDFDAAFLFGTKMRNDSRFKWHATRSLAIMARSGLFHIECVNPNASGTKRYRIMSNNSVQLH